MGGGEIRGTLADEGAAMKKGKGATLWALLVVTLAVLAGLFFLMGGDDDRRVHRELGRKINGVKLDGFDRFWACAIDGDDYKDMHSNADLVYAVTRRAEEVGAPYVEHVRDECMPDLDAVAPELDVLIVHDAELKASVGAMSAAVGDLRIAWQGLITYLTKADLEYDEAIVDGHVKKVARAWYDFRKAYAEANRFLKKHLEA